MHSETSDINVGVWGVLEAQGVPRWFEEVNAGWGSEPKQTRGAPILQSLQD